MPKNMENLTIRFAKIDDLPEITAIYNSTVASRVVTADTEPVTVESRIPWFNAHSDDRRPLWVVFENNKMIAWMSVQSFYGRPAYNGTVELSIYLHEDSRGKGLGKKLMQYIIDQCPNYQIKTLLGFIFGHNEPSLKLFYSFGFTIWGNFPRIAVLDEIERDLLILGKRID
jgi:phosphinothricin acetyltransferase